MMSWRVRMLETEHLDAERRTSMSNQSVISASSMTRTDAAATSLRLCAGPSRNMEMASSPAPGALRMSTFNASLNRATEKQSIHEVDTPNNARARAVA